MNEEIWKVAYFYDDPSFEQFDLLRLIRRAYQESFHMSTIVRSFRKAEIWPINAVVLLYTQPPRSQTEFSVVMIPSDLFLWMEEKRARVRRGDYLQQLGFCRGYANTPVGVVMTSVEATNLVQKKVK